MGGPEPAPRSCSAAGTGERRQAGRVTPGQLGEIAPPDAQVVEVPVVEPVELVQRALVADLPARPEHQPPRGREGSAATEVAIPSLIGPASRWGRSNQQVWRAAYMHHVSYCSAAMQNSMQENVRQYAWPFMRPLPEGRRFHADGRTVIFCLLREDALFTLHGC